MKSTETIERIRNLVIGHTSGLHRMKPETMLSIIHVLLDALAERSEYEEYLRREAQSAFGFARKCTDEAKSWKDLLERYQAPNRPNPSDIALIREFFAVAGELEKISSALAEKGHFPEVNMHVMKRAAPDGAKFNSFFSVTNEKATELAKGKDDERTENSH